MMIVFSPQRNDAHVSYSFDGETITPTVGEAFETYDFAGLPDGEIYEIAPGALPFPCVLKARKDAGELTVTLVLTHDHVDRAPMGTLFPDNPYTPQAASALLAARDAALETANEEVTDG